ncbi:MAG: flagellar protein FlbB [Spirochaetes bacterium]|jgi:flagellar protein FlbB|nr:flagellar protein FlbB [Spirochaetota bacterium]
MPDYRRFGPGPRIFALTLLVVLLLAGGTVWFDYLGIIDATRLLSPVLRLVGIEAAEEVPEPEDAALLSRARLEKRETAVAQLADELDQRRDELDSLDQELEARRQELDAREQELAEQENSLNQRVQQFENRRAMLVQNVQTLTSMRPEDAVDILAGYDDQLLIDTLRVTEELAQEAGELSLVPVWLAELPADRAATIQRKMTIKPQE